MSDANRVELRYVEESAYGTTPALPTLTAIRMTSEDLRIEPTTTTSQELRSDRQVADLILTNLRAAGTINFEWAYKAQDWMILSALQGSSYSTAATATDNGGTIMLAIASNVITSSGATGYNWVSNGFTVGRWVRFKGWTTNSGRLYGKISAVTTTTLTLTHVTLANETGPTSCSVTLISEAVNGTTFDSFAIQRKYDDLASEFVMFNGMSPDALSMNATASGVVTGSVTFLGKTETSATSEPGSTTNADNAGDGNDILNATSNVPRMLVATAAYELRTASWQIQNNLRAREVIGTLGAESIGSGTVTVTGTIEAYYESKTEYDKLIAQTDTSLALVFQDNDGNAMLWEFPRVKYSAGQRVGGGINTDVMMSLQFTAIRDATEEITVRYGRFDA